MDVTKVVQVLPPIEDLTTKKYEPKNWLLYYINIWNRQAVAQAIDVETDRKLKADDPEQLVEDSGEMVAVKVRLERRKIRVQDALNIVNAAKALFDKGTDEEIQAYCFGEANLKVDEDMLKPKEETKSEPKPDQAENKETATPTTPEKPKEETKDEASPEAKV